ncbi:ADP-ribosylglycohydrolase family protein [Stigmatella aurantiaca]|uniref:ADP-ribosylglycohydrolase family protein n=1 Tax=Stigmatella aurantiaca (strain DW4/3-1) TaxID=378806 RepID=E3FCT8_STIAD|nr:ADP-ribosylglycohydrolase family protein [Stigmatella aurantiaca]ADO72586.1 ADP-ribosylglycohydrolase family protein [Stigmatella aurantiaca DW4/3-1]
MPPPRRPSPAGPDPLPGLRSRGALLGLAIGDALGAPLRGRNLVAPPFPQLADGMRRHLSQGRMQSRLPPNPFEDPPAGSLDDSELEPAIVDMRKGQVTDETHMACCIAWSLRELKRYDAADVARRYRAWKPHAFDMTDTVREALEEMGSGLPALTAGRRLWLRHHRKVFSHGSLTRTAPIGVFFSGNEQARIQASLEDSALTHYDPRCQLACAALNAAIARAITGGASLEKTEIITAAKTGLSVGAATLARIAPDIVNETTSAKALLWEDLDTAQQPDPMLYGPELHLHRNLGHVRVAFRLAFWEFFHAPSAEAGLVDVVNRGADADAHGALTGALLGAFHGEEALPLEWRRMVLEAMNTVRGPLWNTYHPRHLLALVTD